MMAPGSVNRITKVLVYFLQPVCDKPAQIVRAKKPWMPVVVQYVDSPEEQS